ncbi:hypothetical protein [Vallitalea guaymasensis]|uniref:hypothetical protein n=1 Tax=Vallitalea guaymasensis TaxID=1185412 RepID=UPI000DE3E656|nr:hypothetical protein [Vallitalea guaymasensis]
MRWGNLEEEEKNNFLSRSNIDSDYVFEDGSGLIDIGYLTVPGKIIKNELEDEIIIDDDAVIYESGE